MPDATPMEGGGEPPDPTTEWRLARLERDFSDFRSEVREMRAEMRAEFKEIHGEFKAIREEMAADMKAVHQDIGGLRESVAELRGQIKNLPTMWALITTVMAGQITLAGLAAGLVFSVLRVLGRG